MNTDTKNQDLSFCSVLLIEDSKEYGDILRMRLLRASNRLFHVDRSNNLESGLNYLKKNKTDAILLDLSLPDSQGLATLVQTRTKAPDTAIIVLTASNDEKLGLEALHHGAQDYLVKGQVEGADISKAIRYAIERQEMQKALQNLALIDELTGLYNRRGFFGIAEQQLKLAFRMKKQLLLIFIDLDNFKNTNDAYGHGEGDQALVDLADILRVTFRDSDVVGRIGGDEFAVLAIEAQENHIENISVRLQENLLDYNTKTEHPFRLSVSMGFEQYDPSSPCSLAEIMDSADRKMYRSKERKHSANPS